MVERILSVSRPFRNRTEHDAREVAGRALLEAAMKRHGLTQVGEPWSLIKQCAHGTKVFRRSRFLCRCGGQFEANLTDVRSGKATACRRCTRKRSAASCRTHGRSRTRVYKIWAGIKKRCTDETCVSFRNYGGRGILMCDRWKDSFENFLGDMGECPSDKHSIDRINNDGNYEPGNCRWATNSEQCNNSRRTVKLTINGRTMSAMEWSRQDGAVPYSAILARVNRGWDHGDAVFVPSGGARSTLGGKDGGE